MWNVDQKISEKVYGLKKREIRTNNQNEDSES
jgi:hypothetical protein